MRLAVHGVVLGGVIAIVGAFLQGYLKVEWLPFVDRNVEVSRLPALGLEVDIPRAVGFARSHVISYAEYLLE
jgi:hypothetical protein